MLASYRNKPRRIRKVISRYTPRSLPLLWSKKIPVLVVSGALVGHKYSPARRSTRTYSYPASRRDYTMSPGLKVAVEWSDSLMSLLPFLWMLLHITDVLKLNMPTNTLGTTSTIMSIVKAPYGMKLTLRNVMKRQIRPMACGRSVLWILILANRDSDTPGWLLLWVLLQFLIYIIFY